MNAILVPVGSSTNAKSHLQYAIDFAKVFGAKVYVVQIYNVYTKAGTMIKVDHIIERESRAFLEAHVASVDTKGVEVISRTYKGDLVSTLEYACKDLEVDLIVLEPRTNSVNEEVFLGKTSGKIIKRTQIPALIVPEGISFKPIASILMAVKCATIEKDGVLEPLKAIKDQFKAAVNLLLVKTTDYQEGDLDVADELNALVSQKMEVVSPTTFQGVLEHYAKFQPDLLCVVRRRRGFFSKLWEDNTILKRDFHSTTMPVLVLSGLK